VLVIAPDGHERAELVARLSELAFEPWPTDSGAAAIPLLNQGRYFAALCDLHMPDLGCFGVLRELARLRLETPVVALTDEPTVGEVIALLRKGVGDVLVRPVSVDALSACLDRLRDATEPQVQVPRDAPSCPWNLGAVLSDPPPAFTISGSSLSGPMPAPIAPTRARATPPAGAAAPARPPAVKEIPRPRPADKARAPAPPEPARPRRKARRTRAHPPEPKQQREEPAAARRTPRSVTPGPAAPAEARKLAKEAVRELKQGLEDGSFSLPAIGPLAPEIQRLLNQPTCGAGDVFNVVHRDPAIASTVLRTTNSGMYGGQATITDLKAGCLRLGNRRVLAIAQEVLIRSIFEFQAGPLQAVIEDMWRNVIVCARGAHKLSAKVGVGDPNQVEVAAMFHNLGEIVLLRLGRELGLQLVGGELPTEYLAVIEASHERLGAELLKSWAMPNDLIQLAGSHHSAPRRPESRDATSLRMLVRAAWVGACRAGYTYLPDQDDEDGGAALKHLGLGLDELDEIFEAAETWLKPAGDADRSS